MGQLAKQAAGRQMRAAGHGAEGIAGMLDKAWPRIQAVMPKHMSSERLYQLAISTVNTTPKLAQCDAPSLLSCVMKCSALGLEPSAVDGLGRAYILPYKSKTGMHAQMIIGYKGMIDLARRSGQIKDISARAVYEGDEFDYSFGLEERLEHRPSGKRREAGEKPTHVYCVAHFADGGHYIDVMTYQEVEAIRRRSKAADNGPWVTDYEAMAKKTVVRRAFPYLPVSVEAQSAAAADETSGGYEQQIAFDPIFEAPEEEPEPARDTEPKGLRKAHCTVCGHVFEIAVDAELADLDPDMIACCETPNYEWVED